jgi:hypothetical protein
MPDTPSLWPLLKPYWTYALLLLLVPVAWLWLWQPLLTRLFDQHPSAPHAEKRFLTPADWTTLSTTTEDQPQPTAVHEVKPGQRWAYIGDKEKPDGSPWPRPPVDMDPDIVIIDVKAGWVRYKWPGIDEEGRAKLDRFLTTWRYVDEGARSRAEKVFGQSVTRDEVVRATRAHTDEGDAVPRAILCSRPVLRAELLTDPAMMGYAPSIASGNDRQLVILLMTRQEGPRFRIQDGDTIRQGSRLEVLCARPGQSVTKEEIRAALEDE